MNKLIKMSKLIKKLVSIATTLTVVVMLAGPAVPAKALTAEELQAQIATLQAQLAALTAQLGSLSGGTGTGTLPADTVGCSFSRNLKLGMTGADVMCLQRVLNSNVATVVAVSGVGSAGNETQYFGNLTKAAVIKFQEKYASEVLAVYGLTQGTGFVGETTKAKLNALVAAGGTSGTGGTGGTGGTTPIAAGLTVELASDNPASATIVADSTGTTESAQSMIEGIKVKLTNGDSSEVKVTTIKFTREGISADSDISQAYLYEGDTKLIDYQSFSSSVLTFNYSGGIITIPANSSKVVTLKFDLANNTSSGKTMKFTVAASTDVVTDASAVNGTFPVSGNTMSTAAASDLGQLTVATSSGPATTIDPQEALDVFNFTLAGSDQVLEVRKIKVHNIGSTDANDLQNLKLYDGPTQIGSTIAEMASDKTVVFDLSASPLIIDKGITKNMNVKADIANGTNRTFQFSLQEITDIVVYDTQYKIYVKPNKADTWTIFQHTASTINTGKLTLTRSADAPSGNVPKDGTNITIAKFDVKAEGEDVKITAMDVQVYGAGIGTDDLYQGKVLFNGAQKGTTDTSLDSAAAAGTSNNFTFGNTFIVPADGQTYTLEIKADIKEGDGTTHGGDEDFTVQIASVTATGRDSSASVTVSSATGYQLVIATGALSGAINQAYGDWAAANATAVKGATGVLVGSFNVSAGASEGVDITAISATWSTTTNDCIQNLAVYKGTKETGTKIGNTQSSVTASTTYTFYPAPYISLNASEQFTLNFYADILSNNQAGDCGKVSLYLIYGTGKTTNTSANSSGYVSGQNTYVASAGNLNVGLDAANPVADMIIAGTNGVTLAKLKYSASTSPEDLNVNTIVAKVSLTGGAATTTLKNVIISGDGLTPVSRALNASGVVTFDLTANPWVIPAYSEKVLTVTADVNTYVNASSGSAVLIDIATTTYKGAMSGTEAHEIQKTSETSGNAQLVYKTRPIVDRVAPTGSTLLSDTTLDLFEFTITADAAGSVNLYSLNLNVQLNDQATTTGDMTLTAIKVYDKSNLSTALNDYVTVATGTATTYASSTTAAASTFGGSAAWGAADYSGTKSANIQLSKSIVNPKDSLHATSTMAEIPAGGSKTFVVQGVISGSAQYDSVQSKLADISTTDDLKNAIIWGDGVDVSISSNKVKTLPTAITAYSR